MLNILAVLILSSVCLFGCDKGNKSSADLTYYCVMNGLGHGNCTFTNASSSGTGAKCGKIKVIRENIGKYTESGVFCSGDVGPQSSKKVDFYIPAVNVLCDWQGSWMEVCKFDFFPNE